MNNIEHATAPFDLLRDIVLAAYNILMDEKGAKILHADIRKDISLLETDHIAALDGFFDALDSDALLVAMGSLHDEDAIASNCAVIATCLCDAFHWLQANPAYVSDITILMYKRDLAELLAKVGLSESPRARDKYAHAAWAMLEIIFVVSPYIPTRIIQKALDGSVPDTWLLNEAAISLVLDDVPTEFSLSDPAKNKVLDSNEDCEFFVEVEEDDENGLAVHISPVWFCAPLKYYETSVRGDNVEYAITGAGYCQFKGEGRYDSFLRLLKAVTRGKVKALCP